jgi:hypothetical protein
MSDGQSCVTWEPQIGKWTPKSKYVKKGMGSAMYKENSERKWFGQRWSAVVNS